MLSTEWSISNILTLYFGFQEPYWQDLIHNILVEASAAKQVASVERNNKFKTHDSLLVAIQHGKLNSYGTCKHIFITTVKLFVTHNLLPQKWNEKSFSY